MVPQRSRPVNIQYMVGTFLTDVPGERRLNAPADGRSDAYGRRRKSRQRSLSREGRKASRIPSPSVQEALKHLFPGYPDVKQQDKFFEELGRALTLWQLVESALYQVYESVVEPKKFLRACCRFSFAAGI